MSNHYRGFSSNEWKRYVKEPDRRIKRLLSKQRVLLAGMHLLLTGEVEANLQRLIALFPQPRVEELIELKQARDRS